MYEEQLHDREDAQYRSRLNGNRPAHVTSFGNGWERGGLGAGNRESPHSRQILTNIVLHVADLNNNRTPSHQ